MSIRVLGHAPADIPTPPSGKAWIFLDTDSGALSYKDDTGTVYPLTLTDPELSAIAGLTSAADKVPYFTGSGTAALATLTAAGRALIDDADVAAMRTTLSVYSSAQTDSAISAAVTALVNGAPGILDTLEEIADALGDDANFAATMTTALAAKAPLASPTFTGTPAVPDDPYDATGWNGSTGIPTKNAVRDKIESLSAGLYTDEQAQDAVGSILDNGTVGDVNFTYDDATPKVSGVVKNDAITYAKIQNVSATDKVLGRSTAGSGDVEEITCTSTARSILDDTSVSAVRTTLGLTSVATLAAIPYPVALSDETTAITTGTAKATFRIPFACTMTALPRANVNTVSSSGLPTFDIKKNGTTIFSTTLTIDASEKTSVTAATPAVLSGGSTTFADDDEVTIDITTAGTGAKGAKITLYLIPT
jgi:hypothetical protein